MTPQVLGYGLLGIAIILIIQVLILTLSAAENTIVTYKQERARLPHHMVAALLAGYPSAHPGRLWVGSSPSSLNEHWKERRNPGPAAESSPAPGACLGNFSVALFTPATCPPSDGPDLPGAQAVKEHWDVDGRATGADPALYSAPLVLLVLTLGLSAFTASLARTLDSSLINRSTIRWAQT